MRDIRQFIFQPTMGFQPYCINANICAAALGKITNLVNDVLFFEIDSLGSGGAFRYRQSLCPSIYSDYSPGTTNPSDFLRHQANRPTAKDSDRLTATYSSPIDRTPTSGKN
ncbi:MAG: hypothetical protein DMG80_13340, partial [Acidobacteria bacterium]